MNSEAKSKKRVLIAEDDPVSCHLLKSFLLKWDYDVIVESNGASAAYLLESDDAPRLAVLDWMMPGMEGVQICQRIRERKNRPYIYVLLLTAKSEKRDLVHALKFGADDYLIKPVDSEELRARLVVGERILALQDDLILAREELRFRATHDVLTGVSNRATVMDALRNEISRQVREQRSFGVILADIDHFKNVNDTYGHLSGDEVLQTVTRRMKECIRPYDTLGRYGGEEFLIIASAADEAGTMALAQRIRALIEAKPVMTQSGEVRVTASLGAAVSSAGRSVDPQMLLRLADRALYAAKDNGRNRCELANPAEPNALVAPAPEPVPVKPGER
jgi:two-component system, cell cycle response regulator